MKIGEMLDPRKTFGKAVTEIARENEDIVIFSADSGKSSGFGDFMQEFPERYFESGIMEQSVIGMASGMATMGCIPIFCAIAPFVTCRPYEMFRNDLGYMKQNVKVVGRNSGITYSDLGATHQSLEDFAIIRMIPGVTILAPQDPAEIKTASKAMIEHKGPVYMRIGNPKIPVLFDENEPFVIGKGRVISIGNDLTIISTGSMTQYAMEAANALNEQGIDAGCIGMPTVYPLDVDLVHEAAAVSKRILTVEEHYVDGGLGTLVTECLSEMDGVKVRRMGIPKLFATSGGYEEILDYYGLSVRGIVDTAKNFIAKG